MPDLVRVSYSGSGRTSRPNPMGMPPSSRKICVSSLVLAISTRSSRAQRPVAPESLPGQHSLQRSARAFGGTRDPSKAAPRQIWVLS